MDVGAGKVSFKGFVRTTKTAVDRLVVTGELQLVDSQAILKLVDRNSTPNRRASGNAGKKRFKMRSTNNLK